MRHRRGLTLVEVAISTLLVGLVMVASLKSVGAVTRTWQVTAEQNKGPRLAHQLLTEIMQAPYEDPEDPSGNLGLETGESGLTRADFDDVDDYKNWNANDAENKDGTLQTDWTGWKRQAKITYVNPDTLANAGATDTGLKRIEVKVFPPGESPLTLYALRSRWGAVEQAPGVDMTVVTWVDGDLQIGSGSAPQVSGTNLDNHASDQ